MGVLCSLGYPNQYQPPPPEGVTLNVFFGVVCQIDIDMMSMELMHIANKTTQKWDEVC